VVAVKPDIPWRRANHGAVSGVLAPSAYPPNRRTETPSSVPA
jgi:hypothetical protein